MATKIWVNIGSGNGLLPDGTKPLPEPSDIHIRAISQVMSQPSITKIRLKITYVKFHSNFPGANGLNLLRPGDIYMHQWVQSSFVQAMLWRLLGTKPLHETTLIEPLETNLRNLNLNSIFIFSYENAFENVVCKILAIFHYNVTPYTWKDGLHIETKPCWILRNQWQLLHNGVIVILCHSTGIILA